LETPPKKSTDKTVGLISEFRQMPTYLNHPVFLKYPDALQIHLFVEAFETVNELGSHTAVHKLQGLYTMIRNFSKAVSQSLTAFIWFLYSTLKTPKHMNITSYWNPL
jgi:hypothetical protein